MNFKIPLATTGTELSEKQFWNSVFLYHSSPHLINRRLFGISQLFILEVNFKTSGYDVHKILNYNELYSQIYRIKNITAENIDEKIITNILDQYGDIYNARKTSIDDVKNSEGTFVSARILLSRSLKCKNCVEVVLIDKKNFLVTFSAFCYTDGPFVAPNFTYEIELENTQLMKMCVDFELAEHKANDWLIEHLFPRLSSWAEKMEEFSPKKNSLSLISVEKYSQLYQQLKTKYGNELIRNWTENTDPKKFVYEDIAIVTYLLLLWQQTSNKKQTFVDLGCGNGLLVFILNQEGHPGFGIDIRPRKIWSIYPESVNLKVETIVPSLDYIFPEVDWIIGNHSDELTPWIPVIAARSNSKFFLLPCCSYEFNGQKYQRIDSSQSQYSDYMQYVKEITLTCGFRTEIDKLRIPSTKRTCLVGIERLDNFEMGNITEMLKQKYNLDGQIKTREVVEKVRNCTRINRDIIQNVVRKVVDRLLLDTNLIEEKWNSGGKIALPDLVKILSPVELKEMKNECGGLQTLLKNHRYIFLITNSMVQIRVPTKDGNQNLKCKTKVCWFYENHPNGCLLNDEECHFVHNK